VAALLQPDSGQVLVGGRDISALAPREAARYRLNEVGFVRQSLDLLPGVSALDNAALKLLNTRIGVRDAHRAVTPLLQRLGLEARLRSRAEERARTSAARGCRARPAPSARAEPRSGDPWRSSILASAGTDRVDSRTGAVCSAARSTRRRRDRGGACDGLEVELRGVEAPGAPHPACSRHATLTCCTRERLDVDTQASCRLGGREQLTDRSLVCMEVRTQTRRKDAQLLVGEVRKHSAGERAQHAGCDVIVRRRRLRSGRQEWRDRFQLRTGRVCRNRHRQRR
jgi:hypothetical protein